MTLSDQRTILPEEKTNDALSISPDLSPVRESDRSRQISMDRPLSLHSLDDRSSLRGVVDRERSSLFAARWDEEQTPPPVPSLARLLLVPLHRISILRAHNRSVYRSRNPLLNASLRSQSNHRLFVLIAPDLIFCPSYWRFCSTFP